MRHAAARLRPAALSPAWLLPLGALILWTVGARGLPLGLPTSWAPIALAAPVAAVAFGWLLAWRRDRATWLLVGVPVGIAGAIVVIDPTHTVRHVWSGTQRVELVLAALLVAVLGAWLGRRRAGPPRPLDLLVGLVVTGLVIADLTVVHSVYQRDLNLYLDAGHDFLSGMPVYAQQPLTVAPPDPTQLPFVYAPATLPFFALLALLPQPIVAVGWLGLQSAASLVAMRVMGVPWRWTPVLFLWPPFVQGIWVGNVAIWIVLLFALVPLRPFLVALPPFFRFQTATAGLWLIRERRWRSLAAAVLLGAALALATLPFVGVTRWIDWYHGLVAFQQSTVNLPGIRGFAISRSIGEVAALLLVVALIAASLRLRGGASLANLGLASVAASPTLYLHGLTLALPGLLQLRAAVFWVALLVAVTAGFQSFLWVVLAIGALASGVPLLRHRPGSSEAAWQPLGASAGPWSSALDRAAEEGIVTPEAMVGATVDRPEASVSRPRIVVVMPAYNAAKTLERTYRDIPQDLVDQIILVDDVSRDETVEVARRLGLQVEVHPQNRGYGGNQKTCYRLALAAGADIVVMVHPDYQYDPTRLPAVVAPIIAGTADMVLGSRLLGDPLAGGMPRWKYFANRFLTGLENRAFGLHLSEYHTGFRAYSARLLRTVDIERDSDDFVFDQEFVAQVVAAGFTIGEVAVPTRYFAEASSVNFRRSVQYGLGTLGVVASFTLHRVGLRRDARFLPLVPPG
jgi:hypothetical protein